MKLRAHARSKRLWALAALLIAALLPAACSSLGYYAHSVRGGLELLAKRQSIERLLERRDLPPELASKLRAVLEIRDFATSELDLPDNGSYRRYTDLGRPYAVWTVVAAPELSVEPVVWCFPVAGCVSYRGYFSEQKAERFAAKLRAERFDVRVAGVTTYSTLGWFRDPVLNTFLDLPEEHLAGVIFHELAHQRVYAADDTTFNESFATAVELEGVRRWLEHRGEAENMASYRQAKEREDQFVELVLGTREALAEVYTAEETDDWKRQKKAELLTALRAARYTALKESWGGYAGYDAFFARDLNNAHLASTGAYHQLVGAFEALLAEAGGDLAAFYAEAEGVAQLPAAERDATLTRNGPRCEN